MERMMIIKKNNAVRNTEIIFQRKNITIKYLPGQRLVVQQWFDFVASDDFRKAIDFTLEFAEKNPVHFIVSDALKQAAISPTDSSYAAAVMPQLVAAGLKAFAFVIPEDIFTKISLKKFSDLEQTHQVQYFYDFDEAMNWIKEIEQK
jgi:hypothetical protein